MHDDTREIHAPKPRPTLPRQACLRILEEGLRAVPRFAQNENALSYRDSIVSLSESLRELDALLVAANDPENVMLYAARARSNCARAIAVAVRGAIDWGHLPRQAAAQFDLAACVAPDAWRPQRRVAA